MEQPEDGIRALAEAFALVAGNGERQYEAELYRLTGSSSLRAGRAGERARKGSKGSERVNVAPLPAPGLPVASSSSGSVVFYQALEIARQQQAKSLELRAAMSLARLWRTQNKEAEARQLLEEVYGWFTEGFDTKDLQDAEALLIALGGTVTRTEKKEGRRKRKRR